MKVRKGDIFIAYINLTRENCRIAGFRPVLILQSSKLIKHTDTVLVAPIVSTTNRKLLLSQLRLGESGFGLKKDSIVLFEQIQSISKKNLQKKISYILPIGIVDNKIIEVFDIYKKKTRAQREQESINKRKKVLLSKKIDDLNELSLVTKKVLKENKIANLYFFSDKKIDEILKLPGFNNFVVEELIQIFRNHAIGFLVEKEKKHDKKSRNSSVEKNNVNY